MTVTGREELLRRDNSSVTAGATLKQRRSLNPSLDDLLQKVIGETVSVHLSHCQAEAMMLDRLPPIFDGYVEHPATRLYLKEPWLALVTCEASILVPRSEFAEAERRFLDATRPKILERWQRRGLSFSNRERELHVDVPDPIWDKPA